MPWVYILRGASGRHYIGSNVDLDRRIEEHRRGDTHSPKRLGGGIELAASRECETLAEARKIERLLKAKKNPTLAIFALSKCWGIAKSSDSMTFGFFALMMVEQFILVANFSS